MALVSYSATPSKGATVTATLDKVALLALDSVTSDPWWADDAGIAQAVVTLKTNPGKGKIVLQFDFAQDPCTAQLTLPQYTRDEFQIDKIVMIDTMGDKISLSRATLLAEAPSPEALDFFVAGGGGGGGSGDTVPPVPSPLGITLSNITSTSVDINWGEASDDVSSTSTLQYKVVYSVSGTIDTVSGALADGLVAIDWTAFTLSPSTVSGLDPNTSYYFNVLVRDQAGNIAAYSQETATTSIVLDNPFGVLATHAYTPGSPVLLSGMWNASFPETPVPTDNWNYSWYRSLTEPTTIAEAEAGTFVIGGSLIGTTSILSFQNDANFSDPDYPPVGTYYYTLVVEAMDGTDAGVKSADVETVVVSDTIAPFAPPISMSEIQYDAWISGEAVVLTLDGSYATDGWDVNDGVTITILRNTTPPTSVSEALSGIVVSTITPAYTAVNDPYNFIDIPKDTTLAVGGVIPEGRYYYSVVAEDAAGNSSFTTHTFTKYFTGQATSLGVTGSVTNPVLGTDPGDWFANSYQYLVQGGTMELNYNLKAINALPPVDNYMATINTEGSGYYQIQLPAGWELAPSVTLTSGVALGTGGGATALGDEIAFAPLGGGVYFSVYNYEGDDPLTGPNYFQGTATLYAGTDSHSLILKLATNGLSSEPNTTDWWSSSFGKVAQGGGLEILFQGLLIPVVQV